jgi:hypothetical protein
LNYGATINLSAPFTVSSTTNKAGIFSGCGFLLIYAGGSAAAGNRWYAVSLPSGTVTNLGTRTFTGAYSTENWAVWGWGEFDGTNYYACYRNSGSAAISRMNIATGAVTTIQTYTDLGDMASVIYSPSNSRMYFRHEYSSQFGGTSETLGYVSGTHTGTCPACISARVPVTATVMGIPVNDNICNATTVFVGDNTLNTSSNTCATVESSEPRPYCFKDYDGGGAGHDKVSKTIWCKFTAPVGPPYSYRIYIKTGNESNSPVIPNTAGIFDSELALFNIVSGTPCANTFSTGLVLNTMACSDDHASLVGYPPLNPLYSAFSYTLVPGQTYYIMIDGASYDNAVAGGTKGTREEALLATSTSNNITLTIENDVILPVEWISIRAKKSEDKNRIEWKALFKDGGKIFEIERSEDGKNFKKIGEVKAESANNPDFTYIFDDVLPFSQSYYRIKHTDNSGKEDYSKTVYLNRDAKNFALLELLPNPVREVLTVSFESPSDANVRVSIETVSGSTVYEHQFEAISGTNDMKLNFGHLPKGTYMLKISSSEGQIVKKVVKE